MTAYLLPQVSHTWAVPGLLTEVAFPLLCLLCCLWPHSQATCDSSHLWSSVDKAGRQSIRVNSFDLLLWPCSLQQRPGGW